MCMGQKVHEEILLCAQFSGETKTALKIKFIYLDK
jgi:hypothetical protein